MRHLHPLSDLDDYNRRLAEECPISVASWKAAKGIVYSLLVISIVVFTGFRQAATWQLAAIAIGAVVVFYVGEVREIELAGWLSVVFPKEPGRGRDDERE